MSSGLKSLIHVLGEAGLKTLNVEKRGGSYCVVHGHPQKKGSKTDEPAGTAIHCYSIDKYGEAEARKKANAMHYAIQMSEVKANTSIETPEDVVGSSVEAPKANSKGKPYAGSLKGVKSSIGGLTNQEEK